MKQLILCIIWAVYAQSGLAQSCVKPIKTKPSGAVNTEFSSLYPTLTNPFINSFNWGAYQNSSFDPIQLNPYAGWSGISSYLLPSPYANQSGGYEYLEAPVDSGPQAKDYHWEDGWELMWLNTGYYPNGEKVTDANSNRLISHANGPANDKVPYFALYNRYNRTLRLFANVLSQNASTFDDINFYLRYPDKLKASGILRNTGSYDLPLDQQTSISAVNTNNAFPNNNQAWFSSDIKLGFDPCVCHYTSKLKFELWGINSYNVNLYGRATALQQPLMDNNGNPTYGDFLNTNDVRTAAQGNANLLYKSMQGMMSDYQAELDAYNTRMEDYNSVGNQLLRAGIGTFKETISNGIAGFVPTNAVRKLLLKSQKLLDKGTLTSDDTSTAQGWANSLKQTMKGEMGKQLDHLSMQFFGKGLDKPQPPTMPTATFSEMRISGSISDQTFMSVADLYTPGSFQAGMTLTPYNYPIYNNPTGLYALLETPVISLYKDNKINLLQTFESFDNNTNANSGYSSFDDRNGIERNNNRYKKHYLYDRTNFLYFKLSESLKYKLNHTLDINNDKTRLYVSFQVELESNDLTVNTQDIPLSLGNMELLHGQGNTLVYSSNWYPLTELGEKEFGFDVSKRQDMQSTLSSDVNFDSDIDAILDADKRASYYSVADNPSDLDIKIKKIKMKVMTDMYFNPKARWGREINTTDVYTYQVYDADANVDIIQSNGHYISNLADIHKYHPGELIINGTILSPASPEVTAISGTVLYVDAEKVKITGNVQVQSGYSAEIRAVENIELLPNAGISPDISMYLKNDYFNFPSISEVSESELSTFCTGVNKKYQANSARSAGIEPKEPQQETDEISVTVYPNPTENMVNVVVANGKAANYQFRLYDLTGKVIVDDAQRGDINPTFEIDLSNFDSGIYILEILAGENILTRQRLVKL